MIRRALLSAAAAVALILTPSVAMAYNAPGYTSSVSDPTPAIGQPVTMTVRSGAANANKIIKFVITSPAGITKTIFKRANAHGVVKVTFKLDVAGVYKVEAFNTAGALLSDQTLTVARRGGHGHGDGKGHENWNGHGNGDGHENKTVQGESRSASATSPLHFAGQHKVGLAAGGALLFPGAGAMVFLKRRRSAKAPV